MEVQELRLNNLLQFENNIVSVTGITKYKNEHQIQIKLGAGKMLIPLEELEPVSLTSDLLSQLRVKESYRSDSRIRYELSDIIKYDFDLSTRKILEGFVYCGNYIKCQYLHQLQNLYFIITGEELKIHENFQAFFSYKISKQLITKKYYYEKSNSRNSRNFSSNSL